MFKMVKVNDTNNQVDRIRNLEDKISELSPDGQVVKGITDHFCQTKISHLQNDLEAEKEKVRVYLAVISVWKSHPCACIPERRPQREHERGRQRHLEPGHLNPEPGEHRGRVEGRPGEGEGGGARLGRTEDAPPAAQRHDGRPQNGPGRTVQQQAHLSR